MEITAHPLNTEFLRSVSTRPGVYQMLSGAEVLYIGKAANLRKRLASYLREFGKGQTKTALMLSRVERIETILTTTEKEALILEASLIKKCKPKYNIILRDDKNYPMIKVTVREKWPRIMVTRKRIRDGNRYFGPFASGKAMHATLKLLHSLFPLRHCKTVKHRNRPCLNYQMGKCSAPCADKISHEEYLGSVQQALLILEGRDQEVLKMLKQKMMAYAENLSFEKAAHCRDQIESLQATLERQVIVSEHFLNQDVFGIARKDVSVSLAVLFIRSGKITGAQTFFFNDPLGSDEHILTKTLLQYYSPDRLPQQQLLLPIRPEDVNLVRERLCDIADSRIRLLIPQRGKSKQLVSMANANARQSFESVERKRKAWEHLGALLMDTLKLRHLPSRIECVDISNLGGQHAVGSLVCFRDGEKFANGYRIFKIRCKDTPDDYTMMAEVLERHLTPERNREELPDLLLLDGGKGQLQVAEKVVKGHGLSESIELLAIAKEKESEGEKLFKPGRKNPLLLRKHDPALLFLMRVRDEAHRFGITRHRALRSKKLVTSRLDDIQGLGPQRKKELLRFFGSISNIMKASPDELANVKGIGSKLAESLYQQLHDH